MPTGTVSVEEIVRFLTADAAYVDPDTQDLYVVSRAGDILNEKRLTGAEWSLPNRIGHAKSNGPLTYVRGSTERSLITVGTNSTLSSYKYADSDDEWVKGALDSAGYKPHPDSKLAAASHSGKLHVFYQNNDGKLAEATSADGATWQSGILANANPRLGTFISNVLGLGSGLTLLYQHQDGHLHSLENHNGSWEDKELGNTQVVGDVSNIFITEPPQNGNLGLVYLNSAGKILLSNKDENSELGQIDANGVFKASSSAECGRGGINININIGSGNIWCF